MYILKEGSGCEVWRPTWHMTRTIFRVIPVRNPEDPNQWDAYRLDNEPRGYGDWIRRYDAVTGLGIPGISYIIKNPRDRELDDQQNPAWMLYRAINGAVRSGQCDPQWNQLIFGSANRSAPISQPTDVFVVQAVLVEHKSKACQPIRGLGPDQNTVVIVMSQTAGEALLDKLDERDSGGQFIHGDIIDLKRM